ncbi:MAG: UvrD-helicase domain-containing protein [Leptolyngbyaceae cyanobacterium bins.349]|nr:UvrD-helicase domain-containing protein [Leptolyngbyaceae cyanobacterium bins.349]
MPNFTPSHYQQAIFDWITNGRGDAIVNAVAGSGKTTTLIQASQRLKTSRALFAAFNTHIARTLSDRIPTMTCRTIHSLGNRCVSRYLGRTVLDDSKYRHLCRDTTLSLHAQLVSHYAQQLQEWAKAGADPDEEPEPVPKQDDVQGAIAQLVHFTQCTLTDPGDRNAVLNMSEHFGLEVPYPNVIIPAITTILEQGQDLARNDKIIDYADMLYLPYVWDLKPQTFEWVFVDEAQDLSAAQLHLILKARARGGRMLLVGDPLQAIYGFAGADCESFNRIKETLQAQELPLSICYRCPVKVLELAKKIVPQIEAAPDAPNGKVETIKESKLPEVVKEGDLILCRLTAPLISLCIDLITQRIPARVRGRDIGRMLTAIAREVAQLPGFTFRQFGEFLEEYRTNRIVKLKQRSNSESQIESFSDRVDGVKACYEAFHCKTLEAFCMEIEGLFSDDRPSVILSTVHRAKGLEEERVFILYPDKLPLIWENQQPWELKQEMNLKYVALTRAKAELIFVVVD